MSVCCLQQRQRLCKYPKSGRRDRQEKVLNALKLVAHDEQLDIISSMVYNQRIELIIG